MGSRGAAGGEPAVTGRRVRSIVLGALLLHGVACAEERPLPCPPLYGYVPLEALLGVRSVAAAETGAAYAMTRTLAQGAEWGFRLSADAARPRTIRWNAQENVLLALDTTARDRLGNASIVEAYRVLQWVDACGRSAYAPWFEREMIRVDWSGALVQEQRVEDARGMLTEAQSFPRSAPAPGALYATEIYCGDRLCGDPVPLGARISRVVAFESLWVDDPTRVRRTVVVRTEFVRTTQ